MICVTYLNFLNVSGILDCLNALDDVIVHGQNGHETSYDVRQEVVKNTPALNLEFMQNFYKHCIR